MYVSWSSKVDLDTHVLISGIVSPKCDGTIHEDCYAVPWGSVTFNCSGTTCPAYYTVDNSRMCQGLGCINIKEICCVENEQCGTRQCMKSGYESIFSAPGQRNKMQRGARKMDSRFGGIHFFCPAHAGLSQARPGTHFSAPLKAGFHQILAWGLPSQAQPMAEKWYPFFLPRPKSDFSRNLN